jgi:hypothetical protein
VLNSRTYTGATGSDGSSSVNVGITIPIKTVNSNGFINCTTATSAITVSGTGTDLIANRSKHVCRRTAKPTRVGE